MPKSALDPSPLVHLDEGVSVPCKTPIETGMLPTASVPTQRSLRTQARRKEAHPLFSCLGCLAPKSRFGSERSSHSVRQAAGEVRIRPFSPSQLIARGVLRPDQGTKRQDPQR